MKTAKSIIRIAVLFAIIISSTIAFAGNNTVKLTDQMQAQIDELVLTEKFAEADSLQSTFEAQLLTEQRNKKRLEEARLRLEKRWNAEVSPDSMTYAKVWQWASNDTTYAKAKTMWLGKRYNIQLDQSLPTDELIKVMQTEIDKRKADQAINQRINAVVAQSESKTKQRIADLETRVEQAEGELGKIRYAVNELGYDMQASFDFATHVKHVSDKTKEENLEKIRLLRAAYRDQDKALLEEPTNDDKKDNE